MVKTEINTTTGALSVELIDTKVTPIRPCKGKRLGPLVSSWSCGLFQQQRTPRCLVLCFVREASCNQPATPVTTRACASICAPALTRRIHAFVSSSHPQVTITYEAERHRDRKVEIVVKPFIKIELVQKYIKPLNRWVKGTYATHLDV